MRRAERRRKQRVVLRERRRSVLAQRVVRFATGLGIVLAIGLVAQFAVLRQGSWVMGCIQRHTPDVQIEVPEGLAQLPLQSTLPKNRVWLWFPGTQRVLAARWSHDNPAAGDIHFEDHFLENRVVAHVASRVPLVRWQDSGVDKEGKVFPLSGDHWTHLPKVNVADAAGLPRIGPWIAQLARVPGLWTTVVAVNQDQRGNMSLDTQRGTHVVWGSLDARGVDQKARDLAWVLEDAHQRFGGAALADIRFFDEGRIVVRPKSIAAAGSEG